MDRKKSTVVVVGGGVAGAAVARILQFHADLVLIDPKEYFEIPWAEMRAKVEPSFAERSVINHRDYLTNGKLVTSTAIDVKRTEVLTEEGRLIPFDYLIIATGHRDYSIPTTRKDRLAQFQSENEKIRSSRSILIVGGGPSGVELGGEIAVDYPDKRVTLVHRGSRLMEFVGPKASSKTLDWLRSKRVEVILGQSVVDIDPEAGGAEEDSFKTTAGETIKADCHFKCMGKPLASSWLRTSTLKDSLDNKGRLMVDEHLRVKGHSNIFAVGDITDIPEMKQGYLALKHAEVVAKNLKLLLAAGGKEDSSSSSSSSSRKLYSYKADTSAIAIVSLGRKEAVAQFPYTTICGCVPGLLKSKDLFVGKTRKQMGLSPN